MTDGVDLKAFAQVVRTDALEDAAKVADQLMKLCDAAAENMKHSDSILRYNGLAECAESIAAAIRELKDKP